MSEFISSNTETFREIQLHKTLFVRVHIKQYWHFPRVSTKHYYIHFSDIISQNTFSGSYYQTTLHIFLEFISNNIDTSRVTTKQYCKIILFYKFLLNSTTDVFKELLTNTTDFFHRRCTKQYFLVSVELVLTLIDWNKCKEYLQKSFWFQKVKNDIQKQPFRGVLRKTCSENM